MLNNMSMKGTIRGFLFIEAVTFLVASLIHAGVLLAGDEHSAARNAEGVIAAVLLTGLVLSWVRPAWTRAAGLAAQGFALFGTLVGIFTIVIGIGPQTAGDIIYHAIIVLVLVWGLGVAKQS